jgi:hypothetical protein
LTLSWKANFVKIYIVENKWFSLLETEMKCLLELRKNINFPTEGGEHFLKLQYMYVCVCGFTFQERFPWFKGTVRPDWISLKVVSFDPGYPPLNVFGF